jgi:hypothetical protein
MSDMGFKTKCCLVTVAVVAVFAFWYYWGSSRTPAAQPPLMSLTPDNLDTFRRAFDDSGDRTRLVLLLSPT